MTPIVGKYGSTNVAMDSSATIVTVGGSQGSDVTVFTGGRTARTGTVTISCGLYDATPLLELDSKAFAQAKHEKTYYQKFNRRQVPKKMKT